MTTEVQRAAAKTHADKDEEEKETHRLESRVDDRLGLLAASGWRCLHGKVLRCCGPREVGALWWVVVCWNLGRGRQWETR